jgi:hypothetical protein
MVIAQLSDFTPSGEVALAIYAPAQNSQPFDLYYGSGGQLTPFFTTSISGGKEVPSKKTATEIEASRIIEYISSCFDLTKDELAHICKVQSRKTLYNWIDGSSTPRASTMGRLFDLFMIAKAWKQTNLSNDRKVLSIPVVRGQSIMDMLKESILSREKILFAGSRLALLSTFDETNLRDPFA